MNVYDFDRTIFPGDSSIWFWKYCMKKYPATKRVIPRATWAMIRYGFKTYTWAEVMQTFFRFLRHLPSVEEAVNAFWDENIVHIRPWYLAQKTPEDYIVSAAPDFLVRPLCERLGVGCIATDMDSSNGVINGVDCAGEEKLVRYLACHGKTPIEQFYSDSLSDTPLATYADTAFLVNKNKIAPWPFSQGKKQTENR